VHPTKHPQKTVNRAQRLHSPTYGCWVPERFFRLNLCRRDNSFSLSSCTALTHKHTIARYMGKLQAADAAALVHAGARNGTLHRCMCRASLHLCVPIGEQLRSAQESANGWCYLAGKWSHAAFFREQHVAERDTHSTPYPSSFSSHARFEWQHFNGCIKEETPDMAVQALIVVPMHCLHVSKTAS
jgi:homospermidine synthase